MKDPFTKPCDRNSSSFIIVGGTCSACHSTVCSDSVYDSRSGNYRTTVNVASLEEFLFGQLREAVLGLVPDADLFSWTWEDADQEHFVLENDKHLREALNNLHPTQHGKDALKIHLRSKSATGSDDLLKIVTEQKQALADQQQAIEDHHLPLQEQHRYRIFSPPDSPCGSQSSGSSRTSARTRLVKHYQAQDLFDRGLLRCFLLDVALPKETVIAARIGSADNANIFTGWLDIDVNSVDNLIFLFKPIEHALGLHKLCFLRSLVCDGEFVCKVVLDQLLDLTLFEYAQQHCFSADLADLFSSPDFQWLKQKTFRHINGMPLVFDQSGAQPQERSLIMHAWLTRQHAIAMNWITEREWPVADFFSRQQARRDANFVLRKFFGNQSPPEFDSEDEERQHFWAGGSSGEVSPTSELILQKRNAHAEGAVNPSDKSASVPTTALVAGSSKRKLIPSAKELTSDETSMLEDSKSSKRSKRSSDFSQAKDKQPEPIIHETFPFRCYVCGLQENCHYVGRQPPFARQIRLREDAFVMKDPFTAPSDRNSLSFIVIGGTCSACHSTVCSDSSCSLFYEKRFCNACAFLHKDKFPVELHQAIEKMYSASSAKSDT